MHRIGERNRERFMSMSPVAITLIGFIGANLALVGLFMIHRTVAHLTKVEA